MQRTGHFAFYEEGLLHLALGLHALLVVQDLLADAQVLGGDLKQLIRSQELKAALEAELGNGHQTQGVITAGGAGVGQVLRLADVQLDILGLTVLSDNHTGVNLLARSDEQSTALLCGVQTVGNGLACLESNQGTLFAVFNVALVRCVIFKLGVQDTSSFGGGHEDSTETNQASCRDFELQTGGTIACAAHAVKLAFTPDEEIGCGADNFDVAGFGADYAYTVDGGAIGELEYENFNAASARIEVQGRNIHPGYAKDKMINALQVVNELNNLLPPCQRPEHTEGYEGFYHLISIRGEVENASSEYIIRDHSRVKFEEKKRYLQAVTALLTGKYGEGVIKLTLKDQYYNMREMVEPYPEVIDKAFQAMEKAGVTPIVRPIRGGTDGARLSYMGLPCPNLFTGGMNFHGKYEYCSLNTMQKAMQTILNLIELWGK